MNDQEAIPKIQKYVRAANYLSVAQLYLRDNVLLKEPLTRDHIKPRLLGHWGTCPGINFVYANLNYLITKHDVDMMFVLGPGHGFPALQSNLFLEGSLSHFYPEIQRDAHGISEIARKFSWPYGFPSHSSPTAPGAILEGGELGYSLSTSYGAVLDNPDLIVACLVGDGEAETGPLATSWHLNKLVSPKNNGAVLPILHLNGYKISGPTILGRMSNEELLNLFKGYGYEPIIVDDDDHIIYQRMVDALEYAYQSIRSIQHRARNEGGVVSPRFPMIILRSLKGWTGIKEMHGEKIEGNCLSHQIVAMNVRDHEDEIKMIEEWLRSYKFDELFNEETGFSDSIASLVPREDLRMGGSKHACGTACKITDLTLPEITPFMKEIGERGSTTSSSMHALGEYMREIFKQNEDLKNFRLMSPDETYSNKIDAVFGATKRAFVWPIKEWDKDIADDGRVMEMLSEHSLQGLMQGYVLTGRHSVFASYEAFVQIISSMVDQYAKFMKIARKIEWRDDVPSLNYLLTSSSWRQDHNGFSHQNPGFISDMLQRHSDFVHVYFPADTNSAVHTLKDCLATKNSINIIVAGKTDEPQWLTKEEARTQSDQGVMTWNFASDENPDIVIAVAGDYLVKEGLAAIKLAKAEYPSLKVRFVSVLQLSSLGFTGTDCSINHTSAEYFTRDKPVIFLFHGYPEVIKNILFDKADVDRRRRYKVFGYIENGSTTTPFDMLVRNKTSRYQVVQEMFKSLAYNEMVPADVADTIVKKYDQKLADHREYIKEHSVDPSEIDSWKWSN
jgi:xylulose-5-phosphate/fructose-6-phosphate phosphoketolase